MAGSHTCVARCLCSTNDAVAQLTPELFKRFNNRQRQPSSAQRCRRQLAVVVRAQQAQAATLEKLKTSAPTPSIKEGEDNSIWRTTYDISNVRVLFSRGSPCVHCPLLRVCSQLPVSYNLSQLVR